MVKGEFRLPALVRPHLRGALPERCPLYSTQQVGCQGDSSSYRTKPLPPTPSPPPPPRNGEGEKNKRCPACSPAPFRGGGGGEGFCPPTLRDGLRFAVPPLRRGVQCAAENNPAFDPCGGHSIMVRSFTAALVVVALSAALLPAQGDIQRGKLKKVDAEKNAVTVTV